MGAVRDILVKLGLARQWLSYDMSHGKLAEAQMLADIVSGAMVVRRRQYTLTNHRQIEYRAVNADVVYEVDYPAFMAGTFSYLYIRGIDWMGSEKFDARRVALAMSTGEDPGPQCREIDLYNL